MSKYRIKVCKVVFNSVSHDARVLKEAMSIAELGHDTTIVGIQDANNSRPIEKYENTMIRRSAWKSQALKPINWIYILIAISIVLVSTLTFLIFQNVLDNYKILMNGFIEYVTLSNILLIGIIAYTFKLLLAKYRIYKRRQKVYKAISSQEKNETMKFVNEECTISHQIKINETTPTKVNKNEKSKINFIQKNYPRLIMAGYKKLFDQKSLKTWKTIFAREKSIYNILCEEKPDIIHAHDVSALPVCAKYKREFGCKLVFDAHEMYDHLAQSEADMSIINKKVMLKYSSDVDLFVTINESISNYYKEHYPKFPKAVIVKNATVYAEDVKYDGRLHKVAGIPITRKILLYQGGFASKRGLIPLLMSAEYLNDDWTLVFMGWGNLRNDMKRVANALIQKNPKIAEKIKFVPKVRQKELPYWTNGATLGVIPYENTSLNHWFCTPNKLWEYPNAGVPIIASPFPEMEKVIAGNEIGWFLPDPLVPEEIAQVINDIDYEDLRNARKHCREFIAQDNWSIYAKRLQEKYGELL